MNESHAEALVSWWTRAGGTIAVAESITGGLLADALIQVPGASACVRGGIVAYATEVKNELLGVDAELLRRHGAVHPDVAVAMAQGVRRALAVESMPADLGIATTGIAGPDSPDGQPVGTVFVAAAVAERSTVVAVHLSGDRQSIRAGAVQAALKAAIALQQ